MRRAREAKGQTSNKLSLIDCAVFECTGAVISVFEESRAKHRSRPTADPVVFGMHVLLFSLLPSGVARSGMTSPKSSLV